MNHVKYIAALYLHKTCTSVNFLSYKTCKNSNLTKCAWLPGVKQFIAVQAFWFVFRSFSAIFNLIGLTYNKTCLIGQNNFPASNQCSCFKRSWSMFLQIKMAELVKLNLSPTVKSLVACLEAFWFLRCWWKYFLLLLAKFALLMWVLNQETPWTQQCTGNESTILFTFHTMQFFSRITRNKAIIGVWLYNYWIENNQN